VTKASLSQENDTTNRKNKAKPHWEMTTPELREATKRFDEEFIFATARPLTPEERAQWERVKAKSEPPANGKAEQTIAVRLDKALPKRCTALAKKKRQSQDALIARGVRALLAAEGE
jgi:hypothetical protein